MQKINYDKEMARVIKAHQSKGEKPTLLLHSCCAPCSTACIERLKEFFTLTVYYYNPNIDSKEEYANRLAEQERYCKKEGINFLAEEYQPFEFYDKVKGHEKDLEGGERCFICYRLRLAKTAQKAKEIGCEYFATTLTVSPLKNAEKLNEIGREEGEKQTVKYLVSDFKKQGGYLRSINLSKENKMYRQNYCGCIFSKNKVPTGN